MLRRLDGTDRRGLRPYREVPLTTLITDWEESFGAALRKGDPLTASSILRACGENGWVRRAHLERARELIDEMGPASIVRRDWAARLLPHPRRVDKELAAIFLAPLARSHPGEVERAALRLARDERWDVREAAAALLGEALDVSFDRFYKSCRAWMEKPEPRVRRAIVVAAKYAARSGAPERSTKLLDLIEPALRDRDDYVRRSLGPFAIGDQLLRSYPEETLARLERWAADTDEVVRWNVAMAFSTATGATYAEQGVPLLRGLAKDDSRFVARAAAATLRRIEKRRPEQPGTGTLSRSL